MRGAPGCRTIGAALILAFSFLLPAGSRAALSATAAQSESWRKRAPEMEAPRPFNLPAFREVKLQNGLTLVLAEDHKTPIITMDVAIPVGEASDPPGREGLA